jgi:hypothetical protein
MLKLKNLRQFGTIVSFLSTFFFFCYGVACAFDIYNMINIMYLELITFISLCTMLGIGFVSLFIGSTIQQKIDRETYGKIVPKEVIQQSQVIDVQPPQAEISTHNLPIPEKILADLEDAQKSGVNMDFYIQQQEYLSVRSGGQGQTKPIFIFTIVLSFFNLFLYIVNKGYIPSAGFLTVLASFWDSIYIYTFCLGTISVAFLIAFVAGNVTEDFMRNYIKGYHIHESVVGIYFILIGVPIMATTEFFNIRFSLGNSFLIAGIFLIGRDWKDIVKGNIFVHQSKEYDYEQYLKLSAYSKKKEDDKTHAKHKYPLLLNKIRDMREKRQDTSETVT